jgi:hypothetical protein
MSSADTRLRCYERGDLDEFFGLFGNSLANTLAAIFLISMVAKVPNEIVFGSIVLGAITASGRGTTDQRQGPPGLKSLTTSRVFPFRNRARRSAPWFKPRIGYLRPNRSIPFWRFTDLGAKRPSPFTQLGGLTSRPGVLTSHPS